LREGNGHVPESGAWAGLRPEAKELAMAEVECPNLQANLAGCPCGSDDCSRKGKCCECVRAHLASGSLPACVRAVAQIVKK